MPGLKGPFLKNILKRPFVAVVLNEDDEIVDWDSSYSKEKALNRTLAFRAKYPYNRIILYKLKMYAIIR